VARGDLTDGQWARLELLLPKGKKLPPAKKLVNQLIAAERAVCEHAFAHLKNWRVLTKLRLDVKWATRLVRALLVLNQHEISR
jgi:transposase